MANSYYPGSLITFQGVFQTVAVPPVVTDPAGSVTFVYEGPNGVVTTLGQWALTKKSTGTWTYQVDTTGMSPGTWSYRFSSGPGNGQAANEGTFTIIRSFAA